jgi:NADH dehydrogenase FAD-containing subunit
MIQTQIYTTGARVNTFGIEGVSENALFMKEIEHASKIRNRIIDCFETANIPGQSDSEIERLLHFAVVGTWCWSAYDSLILSRENHVHHSSIVRK